MLKPGSHLSQSSSHLSAIVADGSFATFAIDENVTLTPFPMIGDHRHSSRSVLREAKRFVSRDGRGSNYQG